jgi:3D-(3,5/4)-trihydroxycyclohexane-1,2-dione acylhydrolase (decyclizing)
MGAHAVFAQTEAELKKALDDAKQAHRVSVIVVPVDPEKRMPSLGTWWDVPVAEVSADEKTQQVRQSYEKASSAQRSIFA